MSEEKSIAVSSNPENPFSVAVKSGSEKIGGTVANYVLDSIVKVLKKQYGKKLVLNKKVYTKYLNNAYDRYNKVKTLATGDDSRSIIGKNNIYVQINVKDKASKNEVNTSAIEPLLEVSKNLIIRGTGGAGKSMLFRYLFLNTVKRGYYIPIFLELRKITNEDTDVEGIFNLIYNCMSDFDVTLDREQFKYSLGLGKYVFFLDGFDEIKSELVTQTAEAIQKFASKYPQNAYIISSRPDRHFSPLETFTILDCMDLSKEQAVELSKKLGENSEKTRDFCEQLREGLFDKHKDFISNPLLLSMMFLTFMRNNSIPEYLVDFYEKCYQALFTIHDSNNKGSYKREFKCITLDERSFRKLFSRFCFKTYFDDKYEFTEQELMYEMNWCIEKLGFTSMVSAKEYVDDLCEILCLIIKDGNTYRFAHRSFQTYFSAVYTETLPDDSQKNLFKKLISEDFVYLIAYLEYFDLLNQIEHERFFLNALAEGLNEIKVNCEKSKNPALCYLKTIFNILRIEDMRISCLVSSEKTNKKQTYFMHLQTIFEGIFDRENLYRVYTQPEGELIKIIEKFPKKTDRFKYYELDNLQWLDEKEKHILYDYLIRTRCINERFNKMCEYLNNILKSSQEDEENFFDMF